MRKHRDDQETQTQDGAGQSDAAQLGADKKKLSGLQHQFNELVEEHAKVDAAHDTTRCNPMKPSLQPHVPSLQPHVPSLQPYVSQVDAEHDKQQAYATLKAAAAEQKDKLEKARLTLTLTLTPTPTLTPTLFVTQPRHSP